MHDVKIFATQQALLLSLAEDFVKRANAAVKSKGEFIVVLSGGNTPKMFFDTLTSAQITSKQVPWDKIKLFFGDERYLPINNSNNNYYMADEHLFSKVPILTKNIYPIPTHYQNPKDAAVMYEQTIREVLSIKTNALPKFDLVYLGLGADAHTASLMPFNIKNTNLVDSLWVPDQNMYRITLTPQAINNAINIIFFVLGTNKASAVWQVLEGPTEPQKYPAQLIQCVNNKNIWYLDGDAASKLRTYTI